MTTRKFPVTAPYVSEYCTLQSFLWPFLVTFGNYLPRPCFTYSFPTANLLFSFSSIIVFFILLLVSLSHIYNCGLLSLLFSTLYFRCYFSLHTTHASSEIICLWNYLEGELFKRKDSLFTSVPWHVEPREDSVNTSCYCFILKQSGLALAFCG